MIEIIGYIAAFLTTASFLPQALKTIKTKDTSGISFMMYLMFVCGVGLWLIYGIMIQNHIIILANFITFALAGIVLSVKIYNSRQEMGR